MRSQRPAVNGLLAIANPIERANAALIAQEQARELMAELAEVRAEAVYQVAKHFGVSKTARMLGMSRMNVYRITNDQAAKDPDPVVQEQRRRRAEARAEGVAALMNALERTHRRMQTWDEEAEPAG